MHVPTAPLVMAGTTAQLGLHTAVVGKLSHVPELQVICSDPVDETVVVLLQPRLQTVPLAELPLTQVFKIWPNPNVGVVHCVGMHWPITMKVPKEQ